MGVDRGGGAPEMRGDAAPARGTPPASPPHGAGPQVGSPAMPIGIITGSGTYALPGFEDAELAGADTPFGHGRRCRAGAFARRRRPARLAPRRGPRAAVATRSPTGPTSGRCASSARARVIGCTVCGAVDPEPRARLAGRLRRPALPLQPAARRLAVHVLHRAGRPGARALDLRRPVLATGCARRCWPARRRGRPPRATAAATATSTARASTPRPRSPSSPPAA